LLEENIANNLGSGFSSDWKVYLGKIMKTFLKIE
jgi:hypothetical protein